MDKDLVVKQIIDTHLFLLGLSWRNMTKNMKQKTNQILKFNQ